MLKARKEDDGQIKIYGTLPSKFRGTTGNYAGGFHLASGEVLEREGFFDVVTPEYNRVMETLGEIYLDEANKVYTYDVLPRTDLPTLEEAKINKIEELKRNARDKFSETDWYYIRELRTKEMGEIKEVPTEIVKQNSELYDLVDAKEQEINALTDLEAVLTFNTSFAEAAPTEIEKPKEEIPLSVSVSPSALASEPIPTTEETVEQPVSTSEPVPTPSKPVVETPASASEPIPTPSKPVVETPVSVSEPIPTPETPANEVPIVEEPVVEEPVVETPAVEAPTSEVSTEVVAQASTKKLKNILTKASTKKSSKKSKKTLARKTNKKLNRA